MFGFLRRKKEKSDPGSEINPEKLDTSVADLQGDSQDVPQDEPQHAPVKSGASFTPAGLKPTTATEATKPAPDEQASEDTQASSQNSDSTASEIKAGSSFTPPTAEQWAEVDEHGMFNHLKDRLGKTRAGLTDGMADLLLGKKTIDDDLLEELETRLLSADVGVESTTHIIADLTKRVSRNELKDPVALFEALCDNMADILKPVDQPLLIEKSDTPFVILVIGINGAGKTTTIGKLAKRFQNQGKSVMLAAGDTFRAAAVEQLQTWGERNNIGVIAQGTGADSASVIYDAIESAKSKNIDVVIADTAGRLHTQDNLMDELIKIKRVMGKLDNSAPHETLLVMDAGFGQNGLIQAQQFNQAMKITGLVLTKLDGTAKGGILFAIAEKLATPIRFIGVGEGIDDLREFHAQEFVDALLDKEQEK